MDVLREEISRIPPKREIEFSIEIVPRYTQVAKIPYQMSILELTKLKIQLQTAKQGLHQTQCISLGSTNFIC